MNWTPSVCIGTIEIWGLQRVTVNGGAVAVTQKGKTQ